jgi:hypothetical protein
MQHLDHQLEARQTQPSHSPVDLPSWLDIPLSPRSSILDRPGLSDERRLERPSQSSDHPLTLRTFEIIFQSVLEKLTEGQTLVSIFRRDHRGLSLGAFTRWVHKDPSRKALYKEAKEIRTEAWAGKMIDISDGVDADGSASPEDTARSKLRIDTIKFLITADNRADYGDRTTVDVSGSISIVGALEAASSRLRSIARADAEDDQAIEDAVMVEHMQAAIEDHASNTIEDPDAE